MRTFVLIWSDGEIISDGGQVIGKLAYPVGVPLDDGSHFTLGEGVGVVGSAVEPTETAVENNSNYKTTNNGSASNSVTDSVQAVFQRWKDLSGKNVRLTPLRQKKVRLRVQELGEDGVLKAVENVMADAWYLENEHTGLEMICASQERTEKYRDMTPRKTADGPRKPGGGLGQTVASREQALRQSADGVEERAWASKVAMLCWNATQPPSEPDPDFDLPGNDPEAARAALSELGLDPTDVLTVYEVYRTGGHVLRYGHMDNEPRLRFVLEATGRKAE